MKLKSKKKVKIDEKLISVLRIFVSFIFFMACTTFVAVRGYKCVTKYLTEPQSNRISYRFNSGVAFPAITFCPFDEPGFRIAELEKCQLTKGYGITGYEVSSPGIQN